MEFSELLKELTDIKGGEAEILFELERNMQYIADLTDSDVFMDAPAKTGEMIVLAEARPRWAESAYAGSVAGLEASRKNEPAVYHSFELGAPVRDIKAETQEGKTVKQDVIPIKNKQGETFAVLIREKDITERVRRDRKFDSLVKEIETVGKTPLPDTVTMEINHRIKNNLQVIAGMMRLEAKASGGDAEKIFYEKNVQRVLSISAINDILSCGGGVERLEIKGLLSRIAAEISKVFAVSGDYEITVSGDGAEVSAEIATAVAVVVNELIFNAMEHAFGGRGCGRILITLQRGNSNVTVAVSDDGAGYDVTDKSVCGLGLKIVSRTVKEKLKSDIRITSDGKGTKAAFEIKLD